MKIRRLRFLWLFEVVRKFFGMATTAPETPECPPRRRDTEYVLGQFRTVGQLLNSLDEIFSGLQKLKPRKSQTQKIVRRFGPYLWSMPQGEDDVKSIGCVLEGFKAYGLPTFLITYQPGDGSDHALPHFLVATKTKSLAAWLPKKHCVYYELTAISLCDGQPLEMYAYFEVDKISGDVTPLPSPTTQSRVIAHSKSRHRGQRTSVIRYGAFTYPDLRNSEVVAHEGRSNQAIQNWLKFWFCSAYTLTMFREYTINVIAMKDGARVTFSVPQNQWASFFKDRVKVKNRKGRTKPIFHAVVAHQRQTKKKLTYVKTHYRGLRHFSWGEYQIAIVMPGKHGKAQGSLDIATLSENRRGTVSVTGSAADRINQLFDREAV